LELVEGGDGRGVTSDRNKPEPFLNAMLIQSEYFPDSSPDLVSANCVSQPLRGNDSDFGRSFRFAR
jgi:hypothetical protein